jgi:hypothetical protein
VRRTGQLGMLAVTSNRSTQRSFNMQATANIHSALILVTLIIKATSVLKEPHDITSQKGAFLIVTAMKTSNLMYQRNVYPYELYCMFHLNISG